MTDAHRILAASPADDIDPVHRQIMLAMALLWSACPRATIYALLRRLDFKHPTGRLITSDEVKHYINQLIARGLVVESNRLVGYFRLSDAERNLRYEALLDTVEPHLLRRALYETVGFNPQYALYAWPLQEHDATVAIVRLALLTRTPKAEMDRMAQMIGRAMNWQSILSAALLQNFHESSLIRIDPALRWDLAFLALTNTCLSWDTDQLPLIEWVSQQAARSVENIPAQVRIALAELQLHQGARAAADLTLAGMDDPFVDALKAYALAQQGRWAESQTLFEQALKRRQQQTGLKKRALPISIAWIYPLTLLAQQTPKHLELARKFCIGEAGKRDPDTTSGWGQWVHAIDIRRGDAQPDPALYRAAEYYAQLSSLDHFWRVLLAAWMGIDTLPGAPKNFRDALLAMALTQIEQLKRCGFTWMAEMAQGARQLLNNEEAPAGYFVSNKAEHWRELLSALQTLGSETTTSPASEEESRIVWMLDFSEEGALQHIQPMEQKRGSRGWSKAKDMTLARVLSHPKLAPWDAKVSQFIRPDKYNRRQSKLELAGAIKALVGHPAIVLRNAPEYFVELTEGTPEIEVIHQDDKVTLKVTPPLREGPNTERYYYDADEKREAEALRFITLVQDSVQRVRLIQFSPSQRRAAQLLAANVTIPASAKAELQTAMEALTAHFQLQSDHLQVSRELPAETRLRAELSPLDHGLLLRLVATPLGSDGPRLVPGMGRTRLMALLNGESVGTTRQLQAERTHLNTVLDALPLLEHCKGDPDQCEWNVSEPEDALALVEMLPTLPDIAALDWPKGKAVRVISVDSTQLSLRVKTERDWFKLEGEAKADEGLVFTFEALMSAAQSNSRFIAMGDGVYAALTRRLKSTLTDLNVVAETDKEGTHIPKLAAAWLEETLADIDAETDQAFLSAIEKLRQAQEEMPPLPKTLQAELRPYQEDGYVWALRLAKAGFGACLADDMGLGKTLQSLAVLLSRAADGPALIVAPTSVCGNWVSEASRFAPSLNLHLYSDVDRETVIEQVAAFDVVIVSYNLLQQSSEQFANKQWHTLIADEAQAIKNASAKRSQAVFELRADFRLALSGTPVENRLAELWSIMRFANPGLLGSIGRFNDRFATPIERDKDREAQHTLRRLISPFLLRRTKTQVLQELPARTELVIKITPSTEEASHYEALRRQAVAEADKAMKDNKAGQARLNILAQLTRLRRAACDPRIVTPIFPASGSKIQTFTNLAQELVANGHKALVFSQFVDFLSLLREALDDAGIHYQYLDGATPAGERTKRVAAFQSGESDLFLISLKAGGFGLNLTAADYVVITDPWWNPAAEDQAMGRAHRMGQQRPVTVYRLVTQGTVEEHIVGLHNDKRALAESILGEGDAVNIPSTDELISLIKGA